MHNRQSGAAHVPMVFFILVLVLFLGAAGFAYKMNTENAEVLKKNEQLVADNDTLKKKDQLMSDYIDDIGNAIGKFGAYKGRGDVYGGASITSKAVMDPKEVKKLIDDTLGKVGLGATSTLENAFTSLLTKVSAAEARVKDIESERDKAMAEKAEADKQFAAATTEANGKATEFATNLEQTRNDYNAAKTEQEGRINMVNESLKAKNDELNSEKERAAAKEKELAGQVARHQMHASALLARETLRKPADTADGKVLVAKNGSPIAFVNLGRKDLLQPGTMFRVRSPNSTTVKGYATVTEVMDDRAQVTLSNFTDPLAEYAREGDELFNDLYTPRMTRTIYLMGRFSAPYQKENLGNLLKRLGNKVVDKMAPGVDTVILGNDPLNEAADGFAAVQDSAEYKLASELRVEFANLNQVRDLIKL